MAIVKLNEKQIGTPDLITIKKYHPEVIDYYLLFCEKMGFVPFCGGSYEKQGQPVLYGCITSAYRQGDNGAHGTAGAIDVHVGDRGDLSRQLVCVKAGIACGFKRGGVYLSKTIIHLDVMNQDWMTKNSALSFWLQRLSKKTGKDIYIGAKTIENLESLIQQWKII